MNPLGAFLRRIDSDRSGLTPGAIVFAICALGSWLMWSALAFPARFVREHAPHQACGAGAGSACAASSIALVLVPSVALLLIAFVFRKTLATIVRALGQRLPGESRFLLAPLAASVVFALSWAGSHPGTAAAAGLLPHPFFPGVIGLFTVSVARWGQGIRRVLGPLLAARDRVPIWLRVIALMGLPFGVSVALGRNFDLGPATREQLTVMVGLVAGFLILAPRGVAAKAGAGGSYHS